MNMDAFSDETSTIEPPKYDMLYITFRGDKYETVLPYCEVANGIIVDAEGHNDTELIIDPQQPNEKPFGVSYKDFVTIIEKAFDTKEIVSMSVQVEKHFNKIKIL